MTASDTATPDLGRFGFFGISATPRPAQEIERLGYGTIWIGGSPPTELSFVEPLLEATTTLKVATGIVNIWTAAAQPVAESFHRINAAYPGRFVLGIGVGHPEVQGAIPQALRSAGVVPRRARRIRRASQSTCARRARAARN